MSQLWQMDLGPLRKTVGASADVFPLQKVRAGFSESMWVGDVMGNQKKIPFERNLRVGRRVLVVSFAATSFLGGLFILNFWGFDDIGIVRCVGFIAIMAGVHFVGYRLWQRQFCDSTARSGKVVHMQKTINPDLTWLVGRRIVSVEKKDYSWFFTFDDGGSIATESFWRIITEDGVAVTSEDHGHPFGLPAPVDAANLAKMKIGGMSVDRFNLDVKTGDLSLHFGDKTLQFVTTSAGYDGWRIVHGSQEVICGGGGHLLEPSE